MTYEYLVQNGNTIHYPHFERNPFVEDVCASYTLAQLIQERDELVSNTSLASVKGWDAKSIIRSHRRWYKPTKISDVVEHLNEAVSGYKIYQHNKEAVDTQTSKLLDDTGEFLQFLQR